jgi:chromate transporter
MSASGAREAAMLALKLGVTAFGGPAAHIAMLREEVVVRRKWMDDAAFLDHLGMTNLIPGPNSTEMVMHAGAVRGGGRGLVLAGVAFILPAALITAIFAWLYVQFGSTPSGERFLLAIKPVVIAVVAQAIWGLAKAAPRTWETATVVSIALAAFALGVNELIVLFGGAALMLGLRSVRSATAAVVAWPLALPATLAAVSSEPTLARLFLAFLKIGSVLYGSGYVLLAFLRGEFVDRLGWITEQQLLDAVAVGQVTPGPVFTTATFVGYLMLGWSGAAVATVGIFVPAFIFVALSRPLLGRLQRGARTRALLDGVNLSALALMAGVSVVLGRDALVSWWTVTIAIVALIALVRFKVNSTWLMLAAAGVGVVAAATA